MPSKSSKFEHPRIPSTEQIQKYRSPAEIVTFREAQLGPEERLEFAGLMLPEAPINFRTSKRNSTIGTENGVFLASEGNDDRPDVTKVFGKSGFNFYLFYGLSMHLCKIHPHDDITPPPMTFNGIAGNMRKMVDSDAQVAEDEFDRLYELIGSAVGTNHESVGPIFQDLLTVVARFSEFRSTLAGDNE